MKKLKIGLLLLCTCLLARSQTVIFSGEVLDSSIVESNLDTLVIDNCTIENISGFGAQFFNIDYVRITNSRFKNLTNGAIRGSACGYILIDNNIIDSIEHFAILLPHSSQKNGTIHILDNDVSHIKNNNDETGTALRVYNADSVFIRNNRISHCEWAGIAAGRNSSIQNEQKIDYLLIDSNHISYTLSDGISTQENITTAIATNNIISSVAYDGIGGRPNHGDHGIYWQAPDGLIEGNEIYDIQDGENCDFGCKGVGISLRTSAKVFRNKIYNCSGRGIAYFNDHPRGQEALIISNNIVFDNQFNGIYINGDSNRSKPDSVFLYNNTVVNRPIQALWHHSCPIAINNMPGTQNINGNIMIYEDHLDTEQVLWQSTDVSIEENSYNILSNEDIGFIDLVNRDLDLSDVAILAIERIPETQSFVDNDFYNNKRNGAQDIGAVEYSLLTNTYNSEANPRWFSVFPNPTSEFITLDKLSESPYINIVISSVDGSIRLEKSIYTERSTIQLNIATLPDGSYFIQLTNGRNSSRSKLFIKN